MKSRFMTKEEIKPALRRYCLETGLDYEKAIALTGTYGLNFVALVNYDRNQGGDGISIDDTPAVPCLMIMKQEDGSLKFEQTERTKEIAL